MLSQRLSSDLLAAWQSRFPGARARHALMAVADASAFLDLPPADIPATPPPTPAEQLRIETLASAYLARIIPKLPDLFAKQLTIRFERISPKPHQNEQPWRDDGMSIATVMYRHELDAEPARSSRSFSGFIAQGIFGPVLSLPVQDASLRLTWDHWERRASAPLAVFRYAVPESDSRFAVVCPVTPYLYQQFFTAYHAQLAVDPATGTVLRLTLIADLNPLLACRAASVMVEYGPVSIGGQLYICPLRSVSLMRLAKLDTHVSPRLFLPGRDRTQLNDITFSDYRVFRVTTRILNAGNPLPPTPDPPPH